MKIVGICGSMRLSGSNSEWMAKVVLDYAQAKGYETKLIRLQDFKIIHCKGCDVCRKTGRGCTIKNDDMNKINEELLTADCLVVSSPNYFKNVSGLIKDFMDRTNALLYPNRKLEEKKVVGLSVGAEELEDTVHCERALKRFFRGHRMKIVGFVKARADAPGEIKKNKNIKKDLEILAEHLVKRR